MHDPCIDMADRCVHFRAKVDSPAAPARNDGFHPAWGVFAAAKGWKHLRLGCGSWPNEVVLISEDDQLCAIPGACFGHGAVQMCFSCCGADVELLRDLGVGEPAAHQGRDLELPWGEIGDAGNKR